MIPEDEVAEGVDERLDVVRKAVGLPWVAQNEGRLELPGTLRNVLAVLTMDQYGNARTAWLGSTGPSSSELAGRDKSQSIRIPDRVPGSMRIFPRLMS